MLPGGSSSLSSHAQGWQSSMLLSLSYALLLRWLVGLKLISLEQQKSFSKKFKWNEILWIGNIWFVYWNFSGKNCVILLKNYAFREPYVFIELIFWAYFSIQYIHIQRISKTVSYFCLLYWGFLEIRNYL